MKIDKQHSRSAHKDVISDKLSPKVKLSTSTLKFALVEFILSDALHKYGVTRKSHWQAETGKLCF